MSNLIVFDDSPYSNISLIKILDLETKKDTVLGYVIAEPFVVLCECIHKFYIGEYNVAMIDKNEIPSRYALSITSYRGIIPLEGANVYTNIRGLFIFEYEKLQRALVQECDVERHIKNVSEGVYENFSFPMALKYRPILNMLATEPRAEKCYTEASSLLGSLDVDLTMSIDKRNCLIMTDYVHTIISSKFVNECVAGLN